MDNDELHNWRVVFTTLVHEEVKELAGPGDDVTYKAIRKGEWTVMEYRGLTVQVIASDREIQAHAEKHKMIYLVERKVRAAMETKQ